MKQNRILTKPLLSITLILAGCGVIGPSGCSGPLKMVMPDKPKTAAQCASEATLDDISSPSTVLGLKPGVTWNAAHRFLQCVAPDAEVENGTAGEYANEVNKLMKEIKGDEAAYDNFIVWTRGTLQKCSEGTSNGSSEVSSDLQPDDVRFSDYLVSGRKGNGFNCFSRVSEQIVLLLGGPPDHFIVQGVWRFYQPETGNRPQLAALKSELAEKYPALDLSSSGDNGIAASGYTDENGGVLNADEITKDHYLSEPVAPTPPKTTEACGLLWMATCPRSPPQSEIDEYNTNKQIYDQQAAAYLTRKQQGDDYFDCVSSAPRSPGGQPLADTQESKCGTSLYAAASPYPGGFAQVIFVGIYDQQIASKSRATLSDYVGSLRGQGRARSQTPL